MLTTHGFSTSFTTWPLRMGVAAASQASLWPTDRYHPTLEEKATSVDGSLKRILSTALWPCLRNSSLPPESHAVYGFSVGTRLGGISKAGVVIGRARHSSSTLVVWD